MSERRRSEVGAGLRALASPPAVCCLVVWLLNDHVLKDAWPGWVTGKLSDLTGLVVAALLAGTVLAVVGVPRAALWGTGVVAGGFAAVKGSATVAAAVSEAWGIGGFPTRMLADPTDLLALPACLLALLLWRRAVRAEVRRTLTSALGLALLPVGVLATAATSCEPYEGVTDVALGQRVLGGVPGQRVVVVVDDHTTAFVVDAGGTLRLAAPSESRGVGSGLPVVTRACTDDGRRCWRLADGATVEGSLDGGRTWSEELALDAADRRAALAGHEESCGEEPQSTLTGMVVLDAGDRVRVVVAASHTGIWLGAPGEDWRRVDGPLGEAARSPARPPGRDGSRPRLRMVDPDPPHSRTRPPRERPTPTRAPCPSPSTRTVTPHPSNGPPTAHEVCP